MSAPAPRLGAFGDAAVLADLHGDVDGAHRLARLVAGARHHGGWPSVEEVVIGFGTVTVVADPGLGDLQELVDAVGRLAALAVEGPVTEDLVGPGAREWRAAGALELPVCFDGPDLEELAFALGRRPAEVVADIAACELRVAFLGFSPGFAYLIGLSPGLAAVPRRPRPRPIVPAGSVAIGGGFAAVYPQATPGGWNLVGRSSTLLFDAERPPYARLSPGQRLRLAPVSQRLEGPPVPERRPLRAAGGAALVVEDAGTCSLVEDTGRRGVAHLGVPRAGAADQLALGLANGLVGNAGDAAGLELAGRGPRLRATAATHLAVVGDLERPGLVDVRLDGRPVPEAEVVPVAAGQLLEVGELFAVTRALLAVSGGLDTPAVLGSRSSDLLCGLGGGPLRSGDAVALLPPGRPRARMRPPATAGGSPGSAGGATTLRVLPGPDLGADPGSAQAATAAAGCLFGEWRVAPESNRVGLRLSPAEASPGRRTSVFGAVPSRGMVTGAVQCPPGGELVVLGPDHATVGGYPVVAVVCTADLSLLAHLSPGATVRFAVVDHGDARVALARGAAAARRALHGWYPTRPG